MRNPIQYNLLRIWGRNGFGAKCLGGETSSGDETTRGGRPGGRLGDETTKGGNGFGAKRLGFTCDCFPWGFPTVIFYNLVSSRQCVI